MAEGHKGLGWADVTHPSEWVSARHCLFQAQCGILNHGSDAAHRGPFVFQGKISREISLCAYFLTTPSSPPVSHFTTHSPLPSHVASSPVVSCSVSLRESHASGVREPPSSRGGSAPRSRAPASAAIASVPEPRAPSPETLGRSQMPLRLPAGQESLENQGFCLQCAGCVPKMLSQLEKK